jgi:hypothetical protein
MLTETNANRTERTIDNLDDRKRAGTDGGERGVSSSTGRGHGKAMPPTPRAVEIDDQPDLPGLAR